jgi:hypothetical protein
VLNEEHPCTTLDHIGLPRHSRSAYAVLVVQVRPGVRQREPWRPLATTVACRCAARSAPSELSSIRAHHHADGGVLEMSGLRRCGCTADGALLLSSFSTRFGMYAAPTYPAISASGRVGGNHNHAGFIAGSRPDNPIAGLAGS